jgi:hypothetical protein
MGRPLAAPITRVATGYRVEMPSAPGSRRRVRHVFTTHRAAERWRDQALAAHRGGLPLPTPSSAQLGGAPASAASAPQAGSDDDSFRTWGDRWATEYFRELGRAGGAREVQARGHIALIATWMEARDLRLTDMDREQVKAMILPWAGRGITSPSRNSPAGTNTIASPSATNPYNGTKECRSYAMPRHTAAVIPPSSDVSLLSVNRVASGCGDGLNGHGEAALRGGQP